MDELKKRAILRGITLGFIHASPKLVIFSTFLTYVLVGNDMTSGKVFFTLTALNTVSQLMLHFIPNASSGLAELYVAIQRLEVLFITEPTLLLNSVKRILNDRNSYSWKSKKKAISHDLRKTTVWAPSLPWIDFPQGSKS